MGCSPSSRVVPVSWPNGGLGIQSETSINNGSARESVPPNRQQVLRLKIARDVLKDYAVVSLIGKGAFSQVLQVTENDSGQCYAMKMIKRSDFLQNSVEMDVLSRLSPSHPNLLSLHHFFETSGQIYILTDLAEGGDLFEWLLSHGRFQEPCVCSFICQVVLGVQFLHKHAILHRDIKLENVLVKKRSYNTQIMLGDFGLAYIFPNESDLTVKGPCGTLEYQSPEAISGQCYSFPVDMWAIGVMMYTLLFGQLPFTHDNDMTLRDLIIYVNYKTSGQVCNLLSFRVCYYIFGY